MPTQLMKTIACMCVSRGEAKVDRPMANWKENPATMMSAIAQAVVMKNRSSRDIDGGGWCASVATAIPPQKDGPVII